MEYVQEFIKNQEESKSKYNLANFINALYYKVDGFSTLMFEVCYSNILTQLEIGQAPITHRVDVHTCLLGLLVIHRHLQSRKDFREKVLFLLSQLNIRSLR